MKRTISASLNGKAFTFEDDAYSALERYLKLLEKHFEKEQGKDELLSDIESRIAEHFENFLKVPGQVINLSEVKRVIGLMGMPNEIDSAETNLSSFNGKNYSKLYRDVENRIIGGVCSGMGHYWRVDPILFRLLFVLLAIWGGMGILLYIVLWVVVPPAITPSQKLEMKGEVINIDNINRKS